MSLWCGLQRGVRVREVRKRRANAAVAALAQCRVRICDRRVVGLGRVRRGRRLVRRLVPCRLVRRPKVHRVCHLV